MQTVKRISRVAPPVKIENARGIVGTPACLVE